MEFIVTITQGYDHVAFSYGSIDDVLSLIGLISKDTKNETTISISVTPITINAAE